VKNLIVVMILFAVVAPISAQQVQFDLEGWLLQRTFYTYEPEGTTLYEQVEGDLLAVAEVGGDVRVTQLTLTTGLDATALAGEIVHLATGERVFGAVLTFMEEGIDTYTVSPLAANRDKRAASIATQHLIGVITGVDVNIDFGHPDYIGDGDCDHCEQDQIIDFADCAFDYNVCAGFAAAAWVVCVAACPACVPACNAGLVLAEAACITSLVTCENRANRDYNTCIDRCCAEIGTSCIP